MRLVLDPPAWIRNLTAHSPTCGPLVGRIPVCHSPRTGACHPPLIDPVFSSPRSPVTPP